MKSNTPKRLLYFISIVLILFFIGRLYYRLTDDFRISNITFDVSQVGSWKESDLDPAQRERLQSILSQKFTYIDKGAQSYAFGSEDGKYVIKFFKFKHLKPGLLDRLHPSREARAEKIARKERLLKSIFDGHTIAYAVHREETGILYNHLVPTNTLKQQAVVVDKAGLTRRIDLDSVVFVVQERAVPSRKVLNHALKKGDLELAKRRIGQLFALYLSEYGKGIYDRDHGVLHNTGFVGEKPIHFDVGKLTADGNIREPRHYRDDLLKVAAKIEKWVRLNHPQSYPVIVDDLEERLSAIFGERFHFS